VARWPFCLKPKWSSTNTPSNADFYRSSNNYRICLEFTQKHEPDKRPGHPEVYPSHRDDYPAHPEVYASHRETYPGDPFAKTSVFLVFFCVLITPKYAQKRIPLIRIFIRVTR